MGHLLTIWTIRLAMVFYATVLAGCLTGRLSARRQRSLWTIGFSFFFAHLVCAFHFYHHWSNQLAVADTARQTKELMNWEFGEGIYFSYLFGLLWMADVLWSWCGFHSYSRRPRWLTLSIHGYLFFIAFNGVVVFENGPIRIAGVAVCLILAALAWRRCRRGAIQSEAVAECRAQV